MAELTIEQQRALALARARRRRADASAPSTAGDVVRSFGSGLRSGAEGLVGMFGDANRMTGDVAAWGARQLGAGEGAQDAIRTGARFLSPFPGAPTTENVQSVTNPVVGEAYQPQTTAGEYARTVAQFIPGSVVAPGSTARNVGVGIASALGSEAAGQMTEDTAAEPYARVVGAVGGAMVPGGISRALSARNAPSAAQRMAARAASADAVSPETVRALGPEAMAMDAGPNLRQQAGAVAATPGAGQQTVRGAIAARQQGAGDRVTRVLNRILGDSADMTATADDLIAARAAKAKPLYAKAYEKGAGGIMTPEMQRMASSPMFGEAMRKAAASGQDRAVLEGFGSFNPRVTVTQDGRILFNQTKAGGSPLYPDLQFWDYVKRNLDDVAGEAARAGRNEQASVARSLASRLRDELDKAVPAYKAARQVYAGDTAILNAMEEGQNTFRNTMTPGQLAATLKKMGAAEREAFKRGARAQIANLMGTARNDSLSVRSLFQKGYNKEKLQILLGKERAKALLKALDDETLYANTRDVVTRNSETAARQAAQAELKAGSDSPGFFRSAANFQFGDAMSALGDRFMDSVVQGRQERRLGELAGILAGPPSELANVMSRAATPAPRVLPDPRQAALIAASQ